MISFNLNQETLKFLGNITEKRYYDKLGITNFITMFDYKCGNWFTVLGGTILRNFS